jgi:hypothetical protein
MNLRILSLCVRMSHAAILCAPAFAQTDARTTRHGGEICGVSRAVRVESGDSPYGPGDFDCDADIDQADFGVMQACLTDPHMPASPDPSCARTDLNGDGIVNHIDMALFLPCMAGPSYESPCWTCAEAGEEIRPWQYHAGRRCCDGLTEMPPEGFHHPCRPGELCNPDFCSIPPPYETPWVQCAPCGNGICEPEFGENGCNCEDCEICIPEGGAAPVIPGIPDCCDGLTAIGCDAPDELGFCQPCDGAFYCAYCGNGICGLGENECNCPKDCPVWPLGHPLGHWVDEEVSNSYR